MKISFIKSMTVGFLCLAFLFFAYVEDTLKFGIDVLKEEGFERLKEQKIGILTHAPATDSNNTPTYKVFLNSKIRNNIVCFFFCVSLLC